MPEPFIGEHPHRCTYCKSGWLCQGTKCTLKKKGCWQCMTPAKIKVREELRIAARDRERTSGVTPNIFDHPLGEPEYTVVAVYPASTKSMQVAAYADFLSMSSESLDEAVNDAVDKAAEKMANQFLEKWSANFVNQS